MLLIVEPYYIKILIIIVTHDEQTNINIETILKFVCLPISVSSLHERTERLLKLEEEQRQKEANLLVEMREERNKVEQDCYNGLKVKMDELKETLAKEEMEMERKYLKFEENLRNKT